MGVNDVPLLDVMGKPVPGEPTKVAFDPWNAWTVQSDWDVVGTLPGGGPAAIATTISDVDQPGISAPGPLQN